MRWRRRRPAVPSGVARVRMLLEPLSLDAGEVTDKGSINQRAIIEQRAALVERLHQSEAAPDVIFAAPG